jgi:hypothetical protein
MDVCEQQLNIMKAKDRNRGRDSVFRQSRLPVIRR